MHRCNVKIFINSQIILRYLLLISVTFFLFSCTSKPILNATAQDASGNTLHLSDYRGKWIVLNYWASWCDHCQAEITQLNSFYQAHGQKDAVILAVNVDQINQQQLQQLIKRLHIIYPVLATDPGSQVGITDLPGIPMSFLINPKGQLVKTLYGQQTQQGLEKQMDIP